MKDGKMVASRAGKHSKTTSITIKRFFKIQIFIYKINRLIEKSDYSFKKIIFDHKHNKSFEKLFRNNVFPNDLFKVTSEDLAIENRISMVIK